MKITVAAGIAIVAVFVGVIYFARDPALKTQPKDQPDLAKAAAAPEAAKPAAATLAISQSNAAARPVTSDPRLAALMVSPDNGLIEFLAGADGKVIKEIDNDPNSPGFRKPLREYLYAGDKVVGLTAYKYLGDQTQIVRALVTYKPDGSVDKYQESTAYEHGTQRN